MGTTEFLDQNLQSKFWLIIGSPHLFHEYDFAVDPHKSSQLSPAFQAANGQRGSKLIAYFGTGGLRSVERPARPAYHYN